MQRRWMRCSVLRIFLNQATSLETSGKALLQQKQWRKTKSRINSNINPSKTALVLKPQNPKKMTFIHYGMFSMCITF